MKTQDQIQYSPQMEDELKTVSKDLLPKPFGLRGKVWVALLVVSSIISLIFYIEQLRKGLIITDLRDFTPWGIYKYADLPNQYFIMKDTAYYKVCYRHNEEVILRH